MHQRARIKDAPSDRGREIQTADNVCAPRKPAAELEAKQKAARPNRGLEQRGEQQRALHVCVK